MALKTQGFSLSALPKAPSIPGNVGVVDVKAIYDGVKRGLDAFEVARRAPQSMALADAQMQAETAQAPLATRMALANTEAVEAQAPIRTALLAAEASPEMQEAKRQALLNRSVKQPSGDVQLAQALSAAKTRLAEDPMDAQAAQLVQILEPIAARKGMAPVEAQNQRAIDANATRIATTAGTNVTREGIATADREVDREKLAQDAELRREGFSTSENVAKIGAEGRIQAAKAAQINKVYQTAAEQNQQIQSALGSLALLEKKADQYLASSLGAGPLVGSGPALFVRSVFGDPSGQELKAALGQEMTNAVKTVQGLGAMSNIEFGAVMDQLPKTTDVGPAMETKLAYLKVLRPWLAARSNLYMSELENGNSPVEAYQKVRTAFPVPPVMGAVEMSPVMQAAPPAPTSTPTEFKIVEIK